MQLVTAREYVRPLTLKHGSVLKKCDMTLFCGRVPKTPARMCGSFTFFTVHFPTGDPAKQSAKGNMKSFSARWRKANFKKYKERQGAERSGGMRLRSEVKGDRVGSHSLFFGKQCRSAVFCRRPRDKAKALYLRSQEAVPLHTPPSLLHERSILLHPHAPEHDSWFLPRACADHRTVNRKVPP